MALDEENSDVYLKYHPIYRASAVKKNIIYISQSINDPHSTSLAILKPAVGSKHSNPGYNLVLVD
jgi:hypothetical protein